MHGTIISYVSIIDNLAFIYNTAIGANPYVTLNCDYAPAVHFLVKVEKVLRVMG
jgi:hypothetical protein